MLCDWSLAELLVVSHQQNYVCSSKNSKAREGGPGKDSGHMQTYVASLRCISHRTLGNCVGGREVSTLHE